MSEIDWSNAPEWAGAVVESERGVQFWVSQFGGTSARQRIGSLYPEEDARADMTADDHGWLLIEKRPSPSWNGEGLPPVGTVCEFSSIGHHAGFQWCIFHGLLSCGGYIVEFHHKTAPDRVTCDAFDPLTTKFRPIRTTEQIAAEEQNKAVAEMMTHVVHATPIDCELIYRAGYRKQADK